MDLAAIFNKKAVKVIVGIGTMAALAGGMVDASFAGEAGRWQNASGTFDLKDDSGRRLGEVEFRECARDICMYMKEVSPAAQEKLGIPANATEHEIVRGLKAGDGGGLEGGKIVNASWQANDADVTVKPGGDGCYEITASKAIGSIKGKLEPAGSKAQISSASAPHGRG